jgi:hypothetical protein
VPVVPLEIQLESQLRRDREDRAQEIASVIRRRGADAVWLRKALSAKHYERWLKFEQASSEDEEK